MSVFRILIDQAVDKVVSVLEKQNCFKTSKTVLLVQVAERYFQTCYLID